MSVLEKEKCLTKLLLAETRYKTENTQFQYKVLNEL